MTVIEGALDSTRTRLFGRARFDFDRHPNTSLTPVPTANLKRLTAAANRLILAPDERSLQVDLVCLDRTVPVAGCVRSRDPCLSTPTQCAAAQIPEAIGLQQR